MIQKERRQCPVKSYVRLEKKSQEQWTPMSKLIHAVHDHTVSFFFFWSKWSHRVQTHLCSTWSHHVHRTKLLNCYKKSIQRAIELSKPLRPIKELNKLLQINKPRPIIIIKIKNKENVTKSAFKRKEEKKKIVINFDRKCIKYKMLQKSK